MTAVPCSYNIYRQNVHTFWVRMLKAAFCLRELLLRKRNLQHPLVYFTDRPLYRAGDRVDVKVMGREFHDPLHSSPSSAPRRSFRCWTPTAVCCKPSMSRWMRAMAGRGSFRLPENAVAGGYELRLAYRNQVYSSSFRVANYIKATFRDWFSSRKKSSKLAKRSAANCNCSTRMASR